MSGLAWLKKTLLVGLLLLLVLQFCFVIQILLWRWVPPPSTSFMRAELIRTGQSLQHDWLAYNKLPDAMKRAVIAAEDSNFFQHWGVDWGAIENAWNRNTSNTRAKVKIRGGSTITQQLAKNLFLSAERSYLRKAQELLLTFYIEALWSKERILEVYLNSVELGEGIFGVEAAAKRYWQISATRLNDWQAARLAAMLPSPKLFERRWASAYLAGRTNLIAARLQNVALP